MTNSKVISVALGIALSVSSLAGATESPSQEVKPTRVQSALKEWEGVFKNQMQFGADWVKFGLDWEKMQKRMDYIARTCEPEKVAGMAARKKRGKELADKFINSFAPLSSIPSFSDEERANPCAIASRLEDLKKAKVGIRQAWTAASQAGFIDELGKGYNELNDGYKSYEEFGPVSSFFATEIFCQGVIDPGPTLKVGVVKLGALYRTTRSLVENLRKLERQTDALIAEGGKAARLCPAPAPVVAPTTDEVGVSTNPGSSDQQSVNQDAGGVAR